MDESRSDRDLMQAFLEGDPDMFAALVRRYEAPLYRFFRRYAIPAATADDLFQETFFRVYRGMETYDTGREFRPWLYTIALNCLRKRAGRREPPVRSLDNGLHADGPAAPAAPDRPPAAAAEAGELAERVRRAVEAMPDAPRAVFTLYQYENLTYAEIASVVRRPLGTVKSQMHAALEHLRQAQGDYLQV